MGRSLGKAAMQYRGITYASCLNAVDYPKNAVDSDPFRLSDSSKDTVAGQKGPLPPLCQGESKCISYGQSAFSAAQLRSAKDFIPIEGFDHDAKRAKPRAEFGVKLAFEEEVRNYQAVIELERSFEQIAAIKVDDDRSVRNEKRHALTPPRPNVCLAPAR
jgi:hypothetical protein